MITLSLKHYAILWSIIFINSVSLSQQINSWKKLQPAEKINDFHFTNTLTGWAVTNRNNILYTKDGGVHWQTIRSTSYSYSKVYCLDRTTMVDNIHQNIWVIRREFTLFMNLIPHGTCKTWVQAKDVKGIGPIGKGRRLEAIEYRDGLVWICR